MVPLDLEAYTRAHSYTRANDSNVPLASGHRPVAPEDENSSACGFALSPADRWRMATLPGKRKDDHVQASAI